MKKTECCLVYIDWTCVLKLPHLGKIPLSKLETIFVIKPLLFEVNEWKWKMTGERENEIERGRKREWEEGKGKKQRKRERDNESMYQHRNSIILFKILP